MMQSERSDRNITPPQASVIVWSLVFTVIATVALNMPDYPSGLKPATFLHLPIEVPLTGLALLLLPRYLALPLAALSTLATGTVLFLRIADIGVQSAFQRRFNPYLDTRMMADGWNLLSGSIGTFPAALALTTVVTLFLLTLVVLFIAQARMAAAKPDSVRPPKIIFGSLLALGLVLWSASTVFATPPYASLRTPSYLTARLTLIAQSIDDMRAFDQALEDKTASPVHNGLFQAVSGRDVILIFVESYGRSAIDDTRYAPLIRPRLEAMENQLERNGFASASGWTRSPTVGGLSWLAHGTFLSGLWVDNQARYDRLMISEWPSLNRLFRDSGWETAAVMPAITMDWPEAAYYGYDRIFAAKDLEYRGEPFNWVTMPDQYTLSAFDRLVRHPKNEAKKPVMAEIALISSHAPWTPVPRLVDWANVGDGTVFDEQAQSGDPPSVVWTDDTRVRRQYIETIDYSLQTLGDYIAKFGDDAVFIVLGDHQPAQLITGPGASRDVPVHIISRDERLVRDFESDGFTPGMIPAKSVDSPPMDRMRARLIRLFSAYSPDEREFTTP